MIISDFNASSVGQVLSFAGAGALFDLFLPNNARVALSGYLLGDRTYSFKGFERELIRSLLAIFIRRDGHLSARGVFIYSLLGPLFVMTTATVVIGVSSNFFEVMEVDFPTMLATAIILSLPASYLCFAGDYYSLWVSKTIFWDREYRSTDLPLLIALDIFLSLAPTMGMSALIGWGVSRYADVHNAADLHHIAAAFAVVMSVTTLMSVLLTLIQVLTLVSGTLLRLLTKFARRLGATIGSLEIARFPLTICFLIVGIASLFTEAIGSLVNF